MKDDYHSYVFDVAARVFVGQFEEMYRAEQQYGFDSWLQDDPRQLVKRICLEILETRNFHRVLDIGCGKGAFTQWLVREGNTVLGIDISETALTVARSRCPSATFVAADVQRTDLASIAGDGFDLCVCLETLSYLECWPDTIAQMAAVGRSLLIVLDLPPNPIGFVKSHDELVAAVEAHATIVEHILLRTRGQIILFALSRAPRSAGG